MEYKAVAGLCVTCGAPVSPDQPYSFRELTGVEQVTRTGGAGTLRQKKYTGRVYCRDHGVPTPNTGRLFDLPTSPTRRTRK
jgi:hypothetical protein